MLRLLVDFAQSMDLWPNESLQVLAGIAVVRMIRLVRLICTFQIVDLKSDD